MPTWKLGNKSNAGFGANYIKGLAWGKDTFVAVGTGGHGATSTDGINWNIMGGLPYADYTCVTWDGSTFAAGTDAGEVAWSANGTTWTGASAPPLDFGFVDIRDIAGNAGKFIAVGAGGKMAESGGGGGVWAEITTTGDFSTTDINGIAYGDGYFVAVGNGGKIAWMYAANGSSNFTAATDNEGITSHLLDIAFGGGVFVAVGDSGVIMRSTDNGNTWATVNGALASFTNPAIVSCRSIAYGGGRFTMTAYAAGVGGKILTSKDGGLTWTLTTSTCFGTEFPNEIAYGGGKFVAATDASSNPSLGYWAP